MKLSKPSNNRTVARKKPIDRLSFIIDDRAKLVIPVGPRFQVDVPSWNSQSSKSCLAIGDTESDNAKWLGTPTWPLKGKGQDEHHDIVGRGRPPTCICQIPGSIECVKRHVFDKRSQLKIDLGSAFCKWKFDVMGEDVSKLWNQEEQMKFDYIVKKNLTSHGTSFFKFASQCFPWKSKGSIVSYYLNVYIPRRIGVQTRSSCILVDTDDDDDDDGDDDNNNVVSHDDVGDDVLCPKGSHKRFQADFTCSSRKYIKTTKTSYLRSCR